MESLPDATNLIVDEMIRRMEDAADLLKSRNVDEARRLLLEGLSLGRFVKLKNSLKR